MSLLLISLILVQLTSALNVQKLEGYSSALENLAEQDKDNGVDQLLDIRQDNVKILSDNDIEDRITLINVKINQTDLLLQDKGFDISKDDASVLDRAQKQNDRDLRKKDLQDKVMLL